MPGHGFIDNYQRRCELRKAAIRAVETKFPGLIRGSSGYARAVEAKLTKLYKTGI